MDFPLIAQAAAGSCRRSFHWVNARFRRLPDPRRPDMCRYDATHVWWTPTLMFMTRAGSRNAFDQSRNSGEAPRNMGAFCEQGPDDPRFDGEPTITCSDNVTHHLCRVDPVPVQEIPEDMVADLIDRRMLDHGRLFGSWFILVVDGTVQERCRKGFEQGGKAGGKGNAPYRYVLQCALLGPSNTLFPLMHEHVDLHDPLTQKEDCELKAFKRLAARLKARFPRQSFCITGDALFCVEPVAELCEQFHWKYVLTLKEGRQRTLWDELLRLLPLEPHNRLRRWTVSDQAHPCLQDYRWIEHLPLGPHHCTAILQGEITHDTQTLFAYVTNFLVTPKRVEAIVNATGRQRHCVEDYFNTLKNNGVGLEHVFCAQATGSKNYFTMMQIAQILWTLFYHGFLLRLLPHTLRFTQLALCRAVAEGIRSAPFPAALPSPGQFRFT